MLIDSPMTRRRFLVNGAILGAGLAVPIGILPEEAPQEGMRIAISGLGPRGMMRLLNCLVCEGMHVTAVHDTSTRLVRRALRLVQQAGRPAPIPFDHFADLVACRSVDGVVLSGSIRQRAEMTLAAVDAGKHVLVDPPWAAGPDECRRLRQRLEAKKSVVVQSSADPTWDSAAVAQMLGMRNATDVRLSSYRSSKGSSASDGDDLIDLVDLTRQVLGVEDIQSASVVPCAVRVASHPQTAAVGARVHVKEGRLSRGLTFQQITTPRLPVGRKLAVISARCGPTTIEGEIEVGDGDHGRVVGADRGLSSFSRAVLQPADERRIDAIVRAHATNRIYFSILESMGTSGF